MTREQLQGKLDTAENDLAVEIGQLDAMEYDLYRQECRVNRAKARVKRYRRLLDADAAEGGAK